MIQINVSISVVSAGRQRQCSVLSVVPGSSNDFKLQRDSLPTSCLQISPAPPPVARQEFEEICSQHISDDVSFTDNDLLRITKFAFNGTVSLTDKAII